MGKTARILFLLAVLGAGVSLGAPSVLAQDRLIQDIRVIAEQERTIIRIELACQMRFVADAATADGALLELRVAPFDACTEQGLVAGLSVENHRPIGAEAVGLVEVEFSSLGLGDSLLLLSFARPVRYTVAQGPTLRTVEIVVESSGLEQTAPPERRPLSLRVVEPAVAEDYVINLSSTRDAVDTAELESVSVATGKRLYVSQIRIDGELWNRLRVGFFASEAEANAALELMVRAFPRAWIGRAEPAEIALAADTALAVGDGRLPILTSEQLEAEGGRPAVPVVALSAVEIAERMAAARNALLDGDNAAAVEVYREVMAVPGEHRAEALEFLGLAYERSGQFELARSAYEQNLREFPESGSKARVEQRLSSVIARQAVPQTTLRDAPTATGGAWDAAFGLSQYYRRNDDQFDADLSSETTQSALLTDADFSVSHAGESRDLRARISLSHYHDLLDAEQGGRADEARVSFAYFDIAELAQSWDLRVGRQSLHGLGVLGRFDGAHFSYGLGADRRLHLTTGYPVESTRDGLESDRHFVGLAAEFNDLVGTWDLATFLNRETIEGIDARLATGMEARYFDERRSLTAMLDYDIDFSELNMALVQGTWRLRNRVTLSALFDRRMSPIMSTRNALIGQPVETIAEMLLVWTEEEVRQIAADRTAQAQAVTFGVAAPLGERLQVNFDVTSAEFDGTVASGGVLAVPGTGVQTYYSTSLVATGLFATADVNIWNLRIGEADTYQTKLLTWDARFPVGRRLRINPRLRFGLWEGLDDGTRRETVSPALRLLMNMQNRYRFELEVGSDEMTRFDTVGQRDSNGTYAYFGYQAYF